MSFGASDRSRSAAARAVKGRRYPSERRGAQLPIFALRLNLIARH